MALLLFFSSWKQPNHSQQTGMFFRWFPLSFFFFKIWLFFFCADCFSIDFFDCLFDFFFLLHFWCCFFPPQSVTARTRMATSADKFEEFRKYATEGPWEMVSDENGMLISRRSVPGTSLYTQRGITVINAPVLRVRALIENVEARPKWDSMVAKGEMVRRVNENHVVARFTTEAQWPVAAREFFVEVVAEVEPSGKQTILANTPADHEQQFPVTPDFVRGVAQNSGYIIEPVPGAEPEQTKIIFLTQRLSTSTSPTTPPCLALAFNHLHQNICNSRRQGLDPAHRHLVRRRARQDVPRPLQGDVREPRSQVRTTPVVSTRLAVFET